MRLSDYKFSLFWSFFILLLCTVKMTSIPGATLIHVAGFDKFVHFSFFFILSFLLFFEQRKHNESRSSILILAVILLVGMIYGGAIEVLQKFLFTYRTADWYDFEADALGSIIAVTAIYALFNKKNKTMDTLKRNTTMLLLFAIFTSSLLSSCASRCHCPHIGYRATPARHLTHTA